MQNEQPSTRVWTVEELERVWHVEGWAWVADEFGHWCLRRSDGLMVYWHEADGLACNRSVDVAWNRPTDGAVLWQIPSAVVLAVIGAHQGRDSVETLAARLDERAQKARTEALHHPMHDRSMYCEGQDHAWLDAAALIRRGRVKP